jgi:dimethylaniline monooxygenase (N-oxide forming)
MDGMTLNVPAGGVHHDDFWDTIAQNVDVYREDIDHLEKGKIVFANGRSTDADAILCGTGFKDSFPFLTTEQCIYFGLPHPRAAESSGLQKEWADREAVAEKVVSKRFYRVTPPPKSPSDDKFGDVSPGHTPFRLYNCIAPIDPSLNHSIAFVGFSTITNMFANSVLSAIWVTAYLDGKLKLPSEEEMKKDIAYTTTYMRLRNPTYGRVGNLYIFDYFQYLDRLTGETGLFSHRKSWWKEQFQPLLTQDLKGLKDEYIAKYGSDGGDATTASQ